MRSIFFVFFIVLSVAIAFAGETVEKDFSRCFGKFEGTIVVLDMNAAKCTVHNLTRSKVRYTPFSTFKIPNSLIALETGAISGIDQPYPWDTTRYPAQAWWPAQWNRTHTLRSALKYSVVPFYRNLAAQVGEDTMKKYVEAFRYGNMDISSGVDNFWLNGSIKISAEEQVDFLQRFYRGELPASKKAWDGVKQILMQESTREFALSAKTGGGNLDDSGNVALGWYVGYVEREGDVYFFALNITGGSFQEIQEPRARITRCVLQEMKIIP